MRKNWPIRDESACENYCNTEDGTRPKVSRNIRLKCAESENPVIWAACVRLTLYVQAYFIASVNLSHLRYCVKGTPVSSLKRWRARLSERHVQSARSFIPSPLPPLSRQREIASQMRSSMRYSGNPETRWFKRIIEKNKK